MWNVLCTRKGKFTFAGKYGVNLNLFRAEQRKNVPKKPRRKDGNARNVNVVKEKNGKRLRKR